MYFATNMQAHVLFRGPNEVSLYLNSSMFLHNLSLDEISQIAKEFWEPKWEFLDQLVEAVAFRPPLQFPKERPYIDYLSLE